MSMSTGLTDFQNKLNGISERYEARYEQAKDYGEKCRKAEAEPKTSYGFRGGAGRSYVNHEGVRKITKLISELTANHKIFQKCLRQAGKFPHLDTDQQKRVFALLKIPENAEDLEKESTTPNNTINLLDGFQ